MDDLAGEVDSALWPDKIRDGEVEVDEHLFALGDEACSDAAAVSDCCLFGDDLGEVSLVNFDFGLAPVLLTPENTLGGLSPDDDGPDIVRTFLSDFHNFIFVSLKFRLLLFFYMYFLVDIDYSQTGIDHDRHNIY